MAAVERQQKEKEMIELVESRLGRSLTDEERHRTVRFVRFRGRPGPMSHREAFELTPLLEELYDEG